MEATVLGQAGNDTFYMAREDGCACRFTDRTYRAVGIVVDVSLRSKLQAGYGVTVP